MSDTIYRQDAIKSLDNAWINGTGLLDANEAVKQLKDLPSADRPQGQWIDIGTFSHSYKCSICGRTLFNITVGKNHVAKYYPYCHCGARMFAKDINAFNKKGADDGNK